MNEAEQAELRSTPMSRKFEQLAALMQSARVLGWVTDDPDEFEVVRNRWWRLAEYYRA